MDFFDAVRSRHSYRGGFEPTPVPREDLLRIVEAGTLAPSGCNRQTTRFVVVDAPELLDRIRGMHPRNQAFQEARALIACVIDRAPEAAYEGHSFVVEDCAAATENMLLAITALGYASVWIDGWLRVEGRAERIGELLGVPRDRVVRILLPVGRPTAPARPPEKLSVEERVGFNVYPG
jgi:nitroreductase